MYKFLYNIHLYASDEAEKHELVSEIKNRFEEVYKYVSIIEDKVKEDDVLIYTLRVWFNDFSIRTDFIPRQSENKIKVLTL